MTSAAISSVKSPNGSAPQRRGPRRQMVTHSGGSDVAGQVRCRRKLDGAAACAEDPESNPSDGCGDQKCDGRRVPARDKLIAPRLPPWYDCNGPVDLRYDGRASGEKRECDRGSAQVFQSRRLTDPSLPARTRTQHGNVLGMQQVAGSRPVQLQVSRLVLGLCCDRSSESKPRHRALPPRLPPLQQEWRTGHCLS
jgi:hypothetical protein